MKFLFQWSSSGSLSYKQQQQQQATNIFQINEASLLFLAHVCFSIRKEEEEMKKRCLIMHLFCTFTTWQNFKAASTVDSNYFRIPIIIIHFLDVHCMQTDAYWPRCSSLSHMLSKSLKMLLQKGFCPIIQKSAQQEERSRRPFVFELQKSAVFQHPD